VVYALVIVRWATDCQAVVFSASEARRKQWSGKRIGKNKMPNVVGARLALVPNGARNVLEFLLAKKPHFGISKRFPLLWGTRASLAPTTSAFFGFGR
jgi:hypothetical protein